MLSFEIKPPAAGRPAEELEVFLDRDGLASLLAQLKFLQDGRTDHVHLMADSWGGSHLDELPVVQGRSPMRHVRITLL